LHQVGDLFELNVKPRCQKVNAMLTLIIVMYLALNVKVSLKSVT